jgi:hypothetical protein
LLTSKPERWGKNAPPDPQPDRPPDTGPKWAAKNGNQGAVSLALRPEEQRSDREVEKAYGKTGKQSKNQHGDGRWDF